MSDSEKERRGAATSHQLGQARNPRKPIEPQIKTHDLFNSMLLYDSQMYRIARRQLPMSKHNLLGPLCGGPINGKHFIDDAE